MSAILTASDLVVRYNQRAILDAATLGIEEGDRIGLVGRNGCGKTTFLKILAGLQAPDGGEVRNLKRCPRSQSATRNWSTASRCLKAGRWIKESRRRCRI